MRLVGRLDHPNVVRAFDADQANGILYIVMEYVSGQSLGQRLKKGPLPAVEAVTYAAQAALGLAHAHEQGVVHRDVKPSNLLLTENRQVKVLDLGLGVLMETDDESNFATADGVAVGTVDYMSPEQACGRPVDGRSDLFSLGCALYHLITGRQAFPGDSPIERLGHRDQQSPHADHRPPAGTAGEPGRRDRQAPRHQADGPLSDRRGGRRGLAGPPSAPARRPPPRPSLSWPIRRPLLPPPRFPPAEPAAPPPPAGDRDGPADLTRLVPPDGRSGRAKPGPGHDRAGPGPGRGDRDGVRPGMAPAPLIGVGPIRPRRPRRPSMPRSGASAPIL